jgi:hypothetical protein
MSDLRFVRELGAEFERLELEGAVESPGRRFPSRASTYTGRFLLAATVAVPLAIAVLAIALVRSHGSARHGNSAALSGGFAFTGGNCRVPARAAPSAPGGRSVVSGSDGMIRASGGRVSGIPWQLRVQPLSADPGSIEHGRLRLGARQFGLCSPQSVPVPFGLVNDGPHGIVYGYVANGAGGYRITVSAGAASLTGTTTDDFFFIAALPRPACSYRELTVTATSAPVAGLPPAIRRSLNDDPTRFTTTMRFGECARGALVRVISERGQTVGRAPNAPLATGVAQLSLTAPSGSHSRARGTVWELTHRGKFGLELLAFGLSPGRYVVWLLGPDTQVRSLAAVAVKHDELRGSYDLPADAGGRRIVIAPSAPGRVGIPGRIVLGATLR